MLMVSVNHRQQTLLKDPHLQMKQNTRQGKEPCPLLDPTQGPSGELRWTVLGASGGGPAGARTTAGLAASRWGPSISTMVRAFRCCHGTRGTACHSRSRRGLRSSRTCRVYAATQELVRSLTANSLSVRSKDKQHRCPDASCCLGLQPPQSPSPRWSTCLSFPDLLGAHIWLR